MACANKNAPHTNNSQFFITLDRCDHLDRKNTIFGKITGESIYNAMRLNDQEVRRCAHAYTTQNTVETGSPYPILLHTRLSCLGMHT